MENESEVVVEPVEEPAPVVESTEEPVAEVAVAAEPEPVATEEPAAPVEAVPVEAPAVEEPIVEAAVESVEETVVVESTEEAAPEPVAETPVKSTEAVEEGVAAVSISDTPSATPSGADLSTPVRATRLASGRAGPSRVPGAEPASYLSLRSSDMSSNLKAANNNAFAFVSPQAAAANKDKVIAAPSSTSYLSSRTTDMASTIKAANSNAFAFVSPQAAAANKEKVVTAPSSTSYLSSRTSDMASTIKAENNNAFAFVSGSAAAKAAAPAATAAELPPVPESEFCAYDDLVYEPPAHVDISRKEEYLFNEDFLEIFGSTKEEFKKLPKWKRDAKKKEVRLF